MQRRRVVIAGSTGSIGTQAFSVIDQHAQRFAVVAISASGRRVTQLAEQAVRHRVPVIGIADETHHTAIRDAIVSMSREHGVTDYRPELLVGAHASEQVAAVPADVVLNGIDGAAGLPTSLAALRTGAMLALANKESLVMGLALVESIIGRDAHRTLLHRVVPVDSEHSAMLQAWGAGRADQVRRIIVTASGGPFRGYSPEQLAAVTYEAALNHPTWDMGPLVTINSASLVNKALEVYEAHALFGLPMDRIDVTVHPQSVVHSFVEFVDGSALGQCSPPDMKLAIAYGLSAPDRLDAVSTPVDWTASHQWTFDPVDDVAFPAVALMRAAGAQGRTFPAVFNGANEACVAMFSDGVIGFKQISSTIERVLAAHDGLDPTELEQVLAADAWARQTARSIAGGAPAPTGP